MSNKTILEKINALLSFNVKLEQMTLENGTVIEAESFEVGAEVFAIDGENKTPLEVGEYVLADGTKLYVTEIGKIGELASVETEKSEEEMQAELAAQELAKTESEDALILKIAESFKPTFDAINERIENLSKVSNEVKETLSKVTEKKPLVHKPAEKSNFSALNTGKNISGTESRIMAMLSK
jgi:hypothetical protein